MKQIRIKLKSVTICIYSKDKQYSDTEITLTLCPGNVKL